MSEAHRACILVCDDEAAARRGARRALGSARYDFLECEDGRQCLELLSRETPQLVLLDLRMPVMDGWEFARRYRLAPGPHAPIVAFVAALNAIQECANIDTAGIINKPFDLDDLIEAVRTQLPLPTT